MCGLGYYFEIYNHFFQTAVYYCCLYLQQKLAGIHDRKYDIDNN